MKIKLIDKNWLTKLQPLLSQSFGEEVLIQDEIEYFEKEKPKNWFVAVNEQNQPIGFIRYFPLNDNNYFNVEFYANNLATEKELIEKFDNSFQDIVMQFRINKTKEKLVDYLKAIGYVDKIEEFQEYILLQKFEKKENKSIRFGKQTKQEISEIIEILKALKNHSESEITKLIEENKIVVCEKDNEIIGVSLNNINKKTIEIVEIVIQKEFRRQGFGKELLEGILFLYSTKFPKIIFELKVEKENIAAIKLYEKVGFKENQKNCELWLTKKL